MRRQSIARRASSIVAGLAVWAAPALGIARGGGGGHGGGGHSGSSHGGGWSSHGGGLFGGSHAGGYHGGIGGGYAGGSPMSFMTVLLLMFALLAFAVAIYSVYLLLRPKGAASQAGGAMEPAPELPAPHVSAGLAALRATDPDFEAETFLQRAEMTFFLINRAQQQLDAQAGRALLAPAAWAPWAAGIAELQTSKKHISLDNLNVRGIGVEAISQTDGTDRILLNFSFVARPKTISDDDGRTLADAGEDERFGERWTFERPTGTKTVVSGGVTAAKCPQCGAPLSLSETGACAHCGADIASGKFDWTVTAMGPGTFELGSFGSIGGSSVQTGAQGLAALRAADPAFDEAAFMRRAERAFITLQQAWEAGDLNGARTFLSPGCFIAWSLQLEQMLDEHRKNVLEGLHVDGIAPVKVVHGRVFDDVTIRIAATCADYEIDETTGKIVFGDKTPRPFAEFWTFQRAVGVKSGGPDLLDKKCPNCGAPLDVNAVGECVYCNAAVTSGKFDWVLSRIAQAEEYAGVA